MAAVASAVDYPSHPIRLVVPFPAGGGADSWGRLLAEELRKSLGQPVTVDNVPGSGGNNGTAVVATAVPDGYTLLLGSVGPLVVHGYTYANLPFDSTREFVPVSLLESSPIVLVVHPSVPANTLPELVGWAKAHPGTLTFGSNGKGSPEHIAGELFKEKAEVDIRHVPFDGAGLARKQVLQGGVSMMFDPCKAAVTAIKSGRLRALAVAGPSRLGELPDVPTFEEAGIHGFDLRIWTGILVPAGTPPSIVRVLNRAVQEALVAPEVEKELAREGGQSGHSSPEQFADYIRAERTKWRNLAIETGVRNVSGPI